MNICINDNSSNLLEIIRVHSTTKANQVACEFLYADSADCSRLTDLQLDRQARCKDQFPKITDQAFK